MVLLLAQTACRGGAQPTADSALATGRIVVFQGMCDASGAVALDGQRFAAADDEDNILRVYDADRGGPPLHAVDVSPQLDLRKHKPDRKPRPDRPDKPRKWPETDLEAATRLNDRALWLTSHGRDSGGKYRPERMRFFATGLPSATTAVDVVGRMDGALLQELIESPGLQPFELARAAEIAPKDPGGLNLEGLTARPDGGVFLGFRSPVPQGRALVVPLDNPIAVTEGAAPRFGTPILLDLGGAGVRSLSWWRGRYLIVAGATTSGGVSRLYTWLGPGHEPVAVTRLDLAGLNPEGFFTPEDRDEILLLSDDGTVPIDGKECKRVKDAQRKQFRGVWVRLP